MAEQIYTITVLETGVQFPCRHHEFVIAAMARAACDPVRYGCYGGGCGVCKMKLVSGVVDYAKKMSRAHITVSEERQGYVLICCIQPRSDLIIAGV